MLTEEEIVARFEGEFVPLTCRAEVWDYKRKLKFRVEDNAGDEPVKLLEATEVDLDTIRQPEDLAAFFAALRPVLAQQIERKRRR